VYRTVINRQSSTGGTEVIDFETWFQQQIDAGILYSTDEQPVRHTWESLRKEQEERKEQEKQEIRYFVSYTGKTRTGETVSGRASITTHTPITDIDRIEQIEQSLAGVDNLEICMILNYQRFE
jgi:hypothetical protein